MIGRASAASVAAGSVTAIASGKFGPEDWQAVGIVGGLIVGLAGLVINAIYNYRKDRREQREHNARMEKLE